MTVFARNLDSRIWIIHCEERAIENMVLVLNSVCEAIDPLYDVVRRDHPADTGDEDSRLDVECCI